MNPPATCPQCGAPLRTGTLGGLCPACVKRVAMSEPTLAGDDTSPPAKWTPPAVADLAALLPHGDYTVESFVGRGGMGAVYKGTQLRLERTVAIKVMCRDQGVDAAFIERFHREALMLAKLNHPNIVNVIDCGEAGAELLYIVLEFVDGADVMQVIRDGGMTQEMALQIVPQMEGDYTLFFGGHRYELVPAMHTWEQARDEAVQRSGHLATVTSREESDAIIASFSRHLNVMGVAIFLGGTRRDADTSWEWCNDEPFVFTDWHEGEPNSDYFPAYACLWRPSTKVDWFNWDDSPNWHGGFDVGRGFIIEWDGEKLPAPKTGSPVVATREAPFVNSLGMKFIPVTTAADGGAVLFSVWETRNRDWAALSAAVPGASKSWRKTAGLPTGPDHPAATISWVDAVNFCQWLTNHERANGVIGPYDIYRLPTDLEWSTAAGLKNEPGSTPKERHRKAPGFPWGATLPPPPGAGNFADDSALEIPAGDPLRSLPGYEYVANNHLPGYRDGWPVTSPAGSFAPDALGLYDLFGNVWEWCSDLSHGTEPGNTGRVLRGGSWANGQHDGGSLQTSHRGSSPPWERHPTLGFRAVLEIAK